MVYVFQSGNGRGPVKIGYTQDEQRLKGRLKSLQCGNPTELKLLVVLPYAGPRTERALHKAFGRHRIRNEWYTYAAGIQRFVAAAKADKILNVTEWIAEYEKAVARLDSRYRGDRRKRNR